MDNALLHIDEGCGAMIEELLNRMRSFKERTKQDDLLLIVPLTPDESIIIASGGNIVKTGISPELALAMAQKSRKDSGFGLANEATLLRALTELNETLLTFERQTSLKYCLLYISGCSRQDPICTRSGIDYPSDMSPEEILAMAMMERNRESHTP